jgi:hypothetical protein
MAFNPRLFFPSFSVFSKIIALMLVLLWQLSTLIPTKIISDTVLSQSSNPPNFKTTQAPLSHIQTASAEQISSQQFNTPEPPLNYITAVDKTLFIEILQFKVAYQLSDITIEIQTKMTSAVANIVKLSVSQIILNFVEINTQLRRRILQQTNTLVIVSIKTFQGSVAFLSSQLTEEKLNAQMKVLGLKSVIVVTKSTSPGIQLFVQGFQ